MPSSCKQSAKRNQDRGGAVAKNSENERGGTGQGATVQRSHSKRCIDALSLQVKRKYRGEFRRVVNLVRATGVFDDPGDILRALEALREHDDLKIARVKGARTGTCHP